MRASLMILGVALIACQPYQPGSFRANSSGNASRANDFPARQITRGCLDIGMAAAVTVQAEGPVMELYLGNRCDQAVWTDITAMEVTAHLPDGAPMIVGFYDPRDELKPAVLGGRQVAIEYLELHAPPDTVQVCANFERFSKANTQGPGQSVCVQVAGGA